MDNPKVEIKGLVGASSLDEEQKKLWDWFLEKLGDDEARAILDSLQDSTNNLQFLTENLQKKMEAVQNEDNQKWKSIVSEEKDHLSEIEKKD